MSLTSKGHFKIDGEEFLAKSIKVGFESLAGPDSGRTDDGVMSIDWIYRRVRKIEIEMPPCTSEEASRILSAVQGQEYEIEYFDPLANTNQLRGCYTSNSATNLYSGVIRNGLWEGLAFNAIEIAGE